MGEKLVNKSRYLSFLLRHHPEEKELHMDENGYVSVDEIIKKAGYTKEELELIVNTDSKNRYSYNKDKSKLRANQGHSLSWVKIDFESVSIKDIQDLGGWLYHGTAEKYKDSILSNGIISKSRNNVHLSKDVNTALNVGKRHGKPVVFKVNAIEMIKDGYKIYKSENNVYLTDCTVDVKYIQEYNMNSAIGNRPKHIVLTGGPSGGKSTGISVIEQKLTDRGYKVFVLEEMASILIRSGYAPWVVGNKLFQDAIIKLQVERNKLYNDLYEKFLDKMVILHDRGLMDGNAYIDTDTFNKLLNKYGFSKTSALDYYDGVFHLVTAAKGAREFYTLENNKARTETPEQAAELDDKLLKCWNGHQHLRVITNGCDFNTKIDKLMKEVFSLMGIPVHMEIEHKFLIKMPNIEKLKEKYDITEVNIMQTYLKNDDGIEERVRQREIDGDFTFYHTHKRNIDDNGLSREEKEEKISQCEYLKLLYRADRDLSPIIKKRYTFLYKDKYFEMDVYPFWNDKAILELEVSSENEIFELPEGIDIIEDVTNNPKYKNKALAKRHDM